MFDSGVVEALAELKEEAAELRVALARAEAERDSAKAVAAAMVKAAKLATAAELAAVRQQLETEVAARNAVIEELRAMLADLRRPWWRRLLS